MIQTVPKLVSKILGTYEDGESLCFYCGASCTKRYAACDYVLSSFTGRNNVIQPGSYRVCSGCVLCLRESCDVEMIDGVSRHVAKAAMRSFSWVLSDRMLAASKAHLTQLRHVCLFPPEPTYAIVLSDSGKKHLLYRGVVNHSREVVTVTLEEE